MMQNILPEADFPIDLLMQVVARHFRRFKIITIYPPYTEDLAISMSEVFEAFLGSKFGQFPFGCNLLQYKQKSEIEKIEGPMKYLSTK